MFGCDYSDAHPDLNQLSAAGYGFICRYLTGKSPGKALTRDELAAAEGAGLMVVAGYETTGTEALGGRAAGRDSAARAKVAAHELGVPDDAPIYFAVDFDMQPDQETQVAAYFTGIADVLPWSRIGIYGGYAAILLAVDSHLAARCWQTYAWSGGKWHPGAHIRQTHNGVHFAGGVIDIDEAMTNDFGGWDPMTIVDLSQASIDAIVNAVLTADKIPHGQTPDNPQWGVANAVGFTLHLGEDQAPQVTALAILLSGQVPTILPAGVSQAQVDAALAARPTFLADLAAALVAALPPDPSPATGAPQAPAA